MALWAALLQLAVAANGPLPARRGHAYPWGIALQDMQVGLLLPAACAWLPASDRQCPTVLLPAHPPPSCCRHATPQAEGLLATVLLLSVQAQRPDARVINLETSVTTHPQPWPRKGINYRMHPGGWDRVWAGGWAWAWLQPM